MISKRSAKGQRTRPRVLLGLVEIAGYYVNLQRGLTELGVKASAFALSDHPYQYPGEQSAGLLTLIRYVTRQRRGCVGRRSLRAFGWFLIDGLLRTCLFVWAISRFDVFVFGFGVTFLGVPFLELHLLRLLRKRVIAVFHGSDSRPPYLDGYVVGGADWTVEGCMRLARTTKLRVAAFDRLADFVIDNPTSSHFHERPCVRWLAVGIPQAPTALAVGDSCRGNAEQASTIAVRILHSPSHQQAKGSLYIREVIDGLRVRGHAIEFVQISGRPHAEVRRELERCDFVVDQLFSDTPMAGFAAEAAAFGKPAVVGGYELDRLMQQLDRDEIPPTVVCHPDELEATIERLVVDVQYRLEIGRRAYEFISTKWSTRAVAERYMRLIEDEAPREWMFDPHEITYVHGAGLPEDRARHVLASVVAAGRRSGLQVGDKPDLEHALIDFSQACERNDKSVQTVSVT